MARNRLAGRGSKTSSTKSKTANYYALNPDKRKEKLAYDKKYQKKPEQVAKRVELKRHNRRAGTDGNLDNKDASHKNGKIVGMEKQSSNRARNGKGSTKPTKKKTTKKRTTKKKSTSRWK